MRNRFKLSRICSSDDYKKSKRVHIEFIKRTHNERKCILEDIINSIPIDINSNKNKQPYTIVWGKLIKITKEEATNKDIKVIWK